MRLKVRNGRAGRIIVECALKIIERDIIKLTNLKNTLSD